MHSATHVFQRTDAIKIGSGPMLRDFVPTVYGEDEGNTKWVSSISEMIAVGGQMCFNEDQTEIYLTLPAGYKFGIRFFDEPWAGRNNDGSLRE